MGSIYLLTLALVYRCTVGGVTTYSDRPCAPEAVPYQPDTSRISTYDPPPVSRTPAPDEPARRPAGSRRDTSAADRLRHAAACEKIQISLQDVAARMRAGYNAKQGEVLRTRKTRLEQQRRAQKCR